MGITQKVNYKNELICLVMFSPTFVVTEMSKMGHFCISCWWQQKISQILKKILKSIRNTSFSYLRKCIIDLWATISKIWPLENSGFCHFLQTQEFLLYFSRTVTPKPINYAIFWKDLIRSFWCIKYCAQIVATFLLLSAENKKNGLLVTF